MRREPAVHATGCESARLNYGDREEKRIAFLKQPKKLNSMSQTKTVLVTGAMGWLGSRLVEQLARGLPGLEQLSPAKSGDKQCKVRCLVLPTQDPSILRRMSDLVEVVAGDIQNPADCDRFCAGAVDAVLFHTAGIIHPGRVSEFYSINVEGTKNLMAAAVKNGLKRAVVVSSNSPCGCNPHPDHLFDELSPYHPYLNYGRSKMQMELAVTAVHQQGGIETVIIRAPWFYGPSQPPRQSLFFRMIREGKAPIVGSGENLRSMCYIDNLCHGLILAAL